MINIDNDASVLTTGQWVDYEGSKFLVAHMSNLEFQREVMRLQTPYRRRIENGTLDPKVSRELMTKAMSSKLILDWKDVVNAKGEQVPFGPDVCYKALCNNEDLRDFISTYAMSIDNFKKEGAKEVGEASRAG